MQWTLQATIGCDALVGLEAVSVSGPADRRHRCIRCLRLERPRTIEGRRSTVASEFDLSLLLEVATSEEACELAPRCLQEVEASLSFLASAPAWARAISLTDAPDHPVPGTEYTTVLYPAEAKFQVPPSGVAATDAAFLILGKPERVVRALRWIHKSHFAENPVDEFTSLMVAFESVSAMLKSAEVRYWHCSRCGEDIRQCPRCGESTESRMSGADAMREFVIGSLGWSGKDWKTVWQWRCSLLHGEADISMDEEHAVAAYLRRLEEAVVAAVKTVAGLPGDGPPRQVRHRVPFSDAQLVLKWRPPPQPHGG